jgi:hypothetical protein
MRRPAYALAVILAAGSVAPASAQTVSHDAIHPGDIPTASGLLAKSLTSNRITSKDARYAAASIFTNYAGALDRKLAIAPCKPYAKRARACVVRVGAERYRVTAYYAQDLDVMASAKRLR